MASEHSLYAEGKEMPFDGVGLGLDERIGKMDKVIDLLGTPDRWCKGTLKTHDGRRCIRGAIMAVDGVGTLQPTVLRAINEVTGRHYRRIESFNDHPDTDHGQVVEVLARARDDLVAGRFGGAGIVRRNHRATPRRRLRWPRRSAADRKAPNAHR